MFNAWLDANDTILLNALPVTWTGYDRSRGVAESQEPRQFGDDGTDPY